MRIEIDDVITMQWLKELSSDTLRVREGEWIDVIYGIEFQAIDEWELDKLIEIERRYLECLA